ncbi:MAG: hypothetical protein ABS79_00475 [Planctomycetes bacterium SCN 63-9]|nr:MAG: hypothetical protein ABS79_00475 [Planctomycetes bacterium SCN 63-9]
MADWSLADRITLLSDWQSAGRERARAAVIKEIGMLAYSIFEGEMPDKIVRANFGVMLAHLDALGRRNDPRGGLASMADWGRFHGR